MQAGRVPWGHGAHAPGVGVRWVSGGRPGEPSAAENVTLAPRCRRSGESTAEAPSRPRTRVSLPPRRCCRPRPACTFSEGAGPRASGFTRLPCPGPLRAEASVSHGGAPASGARPPLRGHPPLQVPLWVGLWWVRPRGPALLELL